MAQSLVIFGYLFAEFAHGRRPDPETLGEKLMHDGTVLSIVGLAGAAASVPLTLLFGRMLGRGSWDHTLGLRATSLGAIFRWTLAIVAVATGIDLLNWNAGGDVTVPFMVDAYRTANPRLLLVLMLVVGAPLSEELLFRGLLFGGLVGTRMGVTGTVLFTAVTFAAMHVQYDLPNIGVIAVFGICLGMARARTRSISLLRDARRAQRRRLHPNGLHRRAVAPTWRRSPCDRPHGPPRRTLTAQAQRSPAHLPPKALPRRLPGTPSRQ